MKGLGEFFAIGFVVVIVISSISDGSIDAGGVVANVVDFGVDLVEAGLSNMRASGD